MTKDDKQLLERVLALSAKKHLRIEGDPAVRIDRQTGEVRIFDEGRLIQKPRLGLIVFDAARLLFDQKLLASKARGKGKKE